MNTPTSGRGIARQIIFLVLFLAAAVVGIYFLTRSAPAPAPRQVTLRVEASGGYANVSWRIGAQPAQKMVSATVPWEKKFALEQGTQVILTASNPTQTGHITCWIKINGDPWKTATTQAPKDGVACGGIVP